MCMFSYQERQKVPFFVSQCVVAWIDNLTYMDCKTEFEPGTNHINQLMIMTNLSIPFIKVGQVSVND